MSSSNQSSPSILEMPDLDDLAGRIRFAPNKGQIWVHDHQSILLSLSTLSAVRKGLIDGIGIQAAKDLFFRLGYADGQRDANSATRFRPDGHWFSTFSVGPQACSLYGMGWSEVLSISMDRGKGRFDGDFLIHDSAEAKAHLEMFGPSRESVCWMASGYASGFISSFVGKSYLVREIECKGMGCSSCRMVARPLEEWGDQKSHKRDHNKGLSQRSTEARTAHILVDSPDVVGISAGFRSTMNLVEKAAASSATMLFVGETGVGKEVFARLAHRMSQRRDKAFIAVNCGALPESLIESELFGVVRGAFTGATATRPGRFERAEGGTLFLDEISTLTPLAQVKLLRALQEGEIERVGDTVTRRVDVRIMAAANVNLREAVEKGNFREDLYYRLATFPVHIPPLRERPDDIPLLMEHFRVRYCETFDRRVTGFTTRAIEEIVASELPGNVRELQHRIERAVLLTEDGSSIDVHHLFNGDERPVKSIFSPGRLGILHQTDANHIRRCAKELLSAVDGLPDSYAAIERELLENTVADEHGNLSAAARKLGLTRRQVAIRLEKLRQKKKQ